MLEIRRKESAVRNGHTGRWSKKQTIAESRELEYCLNTGIQLATSLLLHIHIAGQSGCRCWQFGYGKLQIMVDDLCSMLSAHLICYKSSLKVKMPAVVKMHEMIRESSWWHIIDITRSVVYFLSMKTILVNQITPCNVINVLIVFL